MEIRFEHLKYCELRIHLSRVPLLSLRFFEDLKDMLGFTPYRFYYYMWKYITPTLLLVLLCASFIQLSLTPPSYSAWIQEEVSPSPGSSKKKKAVKESKQGGQTIPTKADNQQDAPGVFDHIKSKLERRTSGTKCSLRLLLKWSGGAKAAHRCGQLKVHLQPD